jgi:hypothetical protein
MDADAAYPAFGKFESDPPTDAAGTASSERSAAPDRDHGYFPSVLRPMGPFMQLGYALTAVPTA